MEELSLRALAQKYEDLWDDLTDLREGLQEIKQEFEEALGDAAAEITALRLKAGGYCKVVESLIRQETDEGDAGLPFDTAAG